MPDSRLTVDVQPSSQLIKCFRGTDALPSRTVTQVRYRKQLPGSSTASSQQAALYVCVISSPVSSSSLTHSVLACDESVS